MKLKAFLKRRNSKKPVALLIVKGWENEVIWCENPDEIEEQYLSMTVMDYKKEDDCTEVWIK